jgi:uncharacterized OB-fold protein
VDSGWSDERLAVEFAPFGIDHQNKELYRARTRGQLMLMRCRDCGTWTAVAGPVCPQCWSSDVAPSALSGNGCVYAYTFGVVGGAEDEPTVLVELDEQAGLRVAGPLVAGQGGPALIGRSVAVTWVEREGVPVPAFRVVAP